MIDFDNTFFLDYAENSFGLFVFKTSSGMIAGLPLPTRREVYL
jgi:hypothetical protein